MKQILAFFLALALLAPGKCTNNKNSGDGAAADQEEPILTSLEGTTWQMDSYVNSDQFPYVPEGFIGVSKVFFEFGFNTVQRYDFRSRYDTIDGVRQNYEYPGWKKETRTYTLQGNHLTMLWTEDGKPQSETFSITSPTTLVYSGGMGYTKTDKTAPKKYD